MDEVRTEDLAVGLSILTRKTYESVGRQSLPIASVDVEGAFDDVTVRVVVSALLFWRFPAAIAS